MIRIGTALGAALALGIGSAQASLSEDCAFNGIPLYGKVKVVDSFSDVQVQRVESAADLRVQFVDNFADDCGEWELVESFPDFTIEYVDSFPDVTIEEVSAFPGMD